MFAVVVAAALLVAVADVPTPGLTLLGALGVALIAALAADARQARQLEADGERQTKALAGDAERQERALEAEANRQSATLAHDRELADLADLRALLDEGAVAFYLCFQAVGGVSIEYTRHGRSMHERAPEAARELRHRGRALDEIGARLSVRLGPNAGAEVVEALEAATTAALAVSNSVAWLEDDQPEAGERKHNLIEDQRDLYERATGRYLKAAAALAGTRKT